VRSIRTTLNSLSHVVVRLEHRWPSQTGNELIADIQQLLRFFALIHGERKVAAVVSKMKNSASAPQLSRSMSPNPLRRIASLTKRKGSVHRQTPRHCNDTPERLHQRTLLLILLVGEVDRCVSSHLNVCLGKRNSTAGDIFQSTRSSRTATHFRISIDLRVLDEQQVEKY
jgi:hypothetical protein